MGLDPCSDRTCAAFQVSSIDDPFCRIPACFDCNRSTFWEDALRVTASTIWLTVAYGTFFLRRSGFTREREIPRRYPTLDFARQQRWKRCPGCKVCMLITHLKISQLICIRCRSLVTLSSRTPGTGRANPDVCCSRTFWTVSARQQHEASRSRAYHY